MSVFIELPVYVGAGDPQLQFINVDRIVRIYPNPADSNSTTIEFDTQNSIMVRLEYRDLKDRIIKLNPST
jgi:hypothetical protein